MKLCIGGNVKDKDFGCFDSLKLGKTKKKWHFKIAKIWNFDSFKMYCVDLGYCIAMTKCGFQPKNKLQQFHTNCACLDFKHCTAYIGSKGEISFFLFVFVLQVSTW